MRGFFEGWYYKQQANGRTLAVIPALHQDEKGQKSASIQIITDSFSCNIAYPAEQCSMRRTKPQCIIGENWFSDKGLRLRIKHNEVTVQAALAFGSPMQPRYDIMGPFAAVPLMQCRHRVYSLRHSVNGCVQINGERFVLTDGIGYIEGDSGSSFPAQYLWTQSFFDGGALMLSAATIPMLHGSFTGIIGIISLHGHEYRLATYCGAKLVLAQKGRVAIRQGELRFYAELIAAHAQPLQAPVRGKMTRTIYESAACRVHYRLLQGGKTLLDIISDTAAFEVDMQAF